MRGVLIAIGYSDRTAAITAALLLGWLFQRNPPIANSGLPRLGWMLVMHAIVPSRPYGSLNATRAGGGDPA